MHEYIYENVFFLNTRIWTSPYRRTRQTNQEILKILKKESPFLNVGFCENINLCEQHKVGFTL